MRISKGDSLLDSVALFCECRGCVCMSSGRLSIGHRCFLLPSARGCVSMSNGRLSIGYLCFIL